MTSSDPRIDLAKLRLASRSSVIEALSDFREKPVDRWLPPEHAAKTGEFLDSHGKALTDYRVFEKNYSDQQAVEVVAATAPNHCMDGWTFLSRALGALLAGDTHTARHLAYYAQLRAGLSILGCNGIGIFNTINFVVDGNGDRCRLDVKKPRERGLPTHSAVWEVLQHWAGEPKTARDFAQAFEFRGVSLFDCIGAIWPSPPSAPLIYEVMATWGVDLKRATDDHKRRNISSYAAQAFNPASSSVRTRLALVHDIWLCLEPDGRGGFPSLDRHLLRKLLEFMQDAQEKATGRRVVWSDEFSKLDPSIQEFISLEFLDRTVERADLTVFTHATKRTVGEVHAMICRGLLLLGTATAIVRTAFADAGFEPLADNLRPWFERVGIARGFWSDEGEPEEITQLWDDIGFAVLDLADWIASSTADQERFLKSLSTQAMMLSQTERACMWGVCA